MASAKHEEKSSPVPAILVALGVVGVAGFIAFTNMTAGAEESKSANQAIDVERPAKDLRLQQQGELVAPAAWADKKKGIATVPVDRAMALVVKQLQDNPAAATPAPPPPPEPAQDADGGAEAAAEGDAAAAATDGAAPEPAPAPKAPTAAPAPSSTP